LCSNDPVCAQHEASSDHERRFLHGSACHGCVLISETSCEQQNDFLDRALVVRTVQNLGAEFFLESVTGDGSSDSLSTAVQSATSSYSRHYTGWKAAMAGAAVIDLVEDYNLLDLPLYMRAYGDTLSFPKDLELMKDQSPGTYVDQMKTPLLLMSDTGDVRVPVVQSYKLYNALKERGQDVRMLLYPVPGHFPADPWRARDIDQKWMEWFVERLK
jgi:Prolyl oligopeptidase family